MKNILFLLILSAIISSCTNEPKGPHYVITGKLSGPDSVTVLLQKREAGKFVALDSAVVIKGEFVLKGGPVQYPDRVYLSQKGKRSSLVFFLENADLTITGHVDSLGKAKVLGSKTQDEYMAYQESLKPFETRMRQLRDEYEAVKKTEDKVKMAEFEKSSEEISNQIDAEETAYNKKYITDHPASYITPIVLQGMSYGLEPAEIESLLASIDTSVAKVTLIQDLKTRVAVMKTVAIGQKAPDFTQNDVNDKPIALSSKIGKSKLLLVDFWAAWCGPCRAENPNVVKVYNEFKTKGFDVYGVSLDRSKEDWLKAIEKDQLTWTHVSDLKYWSSDAAKLYAVNSIPANFLLDESGTIIAKNLRGEALAAKVKELLGKK
jgi:peroxiredoxin